MPINEKILREMWILDLTLTIIPVREIPDCMRISFRNDEYICSSLVFKFEYENGFDAILEFLINKFKEVKD